jgi:hypothetical protein
VQIITGVSRSAERQHAMTGLQSVPRWTAHSAGEQPMARCHVGTAQPGGTGARGGSGTRRRTPDRTAVAHCKADSELISFNARQPAPLVESAFPACYVAFPARQ